VASRMFVFLMVLRIAVPDSLAGDLLAEACQSVGIYALRADGMAAVDALQRREVDLALVPTFSVLRDAEAYAVLPILALSSWEHPFCGVVLKHGLHRPATSLIAPKSSVQEALLAQVLLKEHYGFRPELRFRDQTTLDDLAGDADAVMVVSRAQDLQVPAGMTFLDVGQEWYELSSYPMVWHLAVSLPGIDRAGWGAKLRALVREAENRRGVWVRSLDMTEALHTWLAESLRFRFDDLATASLTEYREYLFSFGVLTEIPDVPIVTFEEEPGEPDDPTPTL